MQHINAPSISVGVSYTSTRRSRLWAAAIIADDSEKALSDKDFADHLQPLAPLAYASYIEGHAIKPTPDSPYGFEKLTVFLRELPETATRVAIIGYVLGNEDEAITLGDIQELTVTVEPLEGTEEAYEPLVMNDISPQTSHASKVLCELRRASDSSWELHLVDRSLPSNDVINRRYGILLDV